MKKFLNPYSAYIITFSVALVLYSFGWSSIYPNLSFPLIAFIIFSFILMAGAGFLWSKHVSIVKEFSYHPKAPVYTTIFLYLLWVLDFWHEGGGGLGIPLLKILLNEPYNYRLFGFPSIHVFTVTFSSFYTVYLFQQYLSTRSKQILILYLINLMAALIIFNRGMLLFNLSSSLLLYIMAGSSDHSSLKKSFIFILFISGLFYFFGVLGTVRVSFEAKTNYDRNSFLQTGQATEAFKNSVVPKEFFWSYMYMSSPMANLQNNIDHNQGSKISIASVGYLINDELLPDFLSKRINRILNREPVKEKLIPEPFNVSTIYSRAFSYCGWVGVFIILIYILLFPLVYFILLKNDSRYFPTAVAIITTVYLFMFFDNTFRFSGLILQLFYPIAFNFLEKRKFARSLSNY